MGDLKKKKNDYEFRISEKETIPVDREEASTDGVMMDRLQNYMKLFYDMQIAKSEKKEESTDGKISDV